VRAYLLFDYRHNYYTVWVCVFLFFANVVLRNILKSVSNDKVRLLYRRHHLRPYDIGTCRLLPDVDVGQADHIRRTDIDRHDVDTTRCGSVKRNARVFGRLS